MVGLSGYALMLMRLVIGVIFIYHGYPKVMDPEPVKEMFISLQLPVEAAWALGYVEVVAGALMLLGLFTSLAGLLLAAVMVGAIVLVQAPAAIEAWQLTAGLERDAMLLVGNLVLMMLGPGVWSLRR